MPVLAGGRLVARVDPKHDRKAGVLLLRGLAVEDGVATDEAVTVTAEAAWRLADHLGAGGLAVGDGHGARARHLAGGGGLRPPPAQGLQRRLQRICPCRDRWLTSVTGMVASGGLGAAGTGRAGGNQLLGRGLRLGRIFGVPIRLDFTWFIGLAIFTTLSHDVWSPRLTGPAAVALSVLFTCAFFTSVLAHELSHALAARVLGIGTMEISLLVFGGVARIVSEPADAAGEALMAMAGPLTSVSLAALLWLANLVLAAFNVLPGFPLDGGRVARAVVWRLTGRRLLATRVTAWFGRGLAVLLIAGGGAAVALLHTPRYLLHVALGLFLWNAAGQGERAARQVERYTPHDAFTHPEA